MKDGSGSGDLPKKKDKEETDLRSQIGFFFISIFLKGAIIQKDLLHSNSVLQYRSKKSVL
jgi:hypothetical protein